MAFVGRVHPLLIHFPIALVIVAASVVVEFTARPAGQYEITCSEVCGVGTDK